MKLKACTRCNCEKPESDFRVKRIGGDGLPRLRHDCKACEWASRSAESRERKRERDRERRVNPEYAERNKVATRKYRARKVVEIYGDSHVIGMRYGEKCAFIARRCECCAKVEVLRAVSHSNKCVSCSRKGKEDLRVVNCRECGCEHMAVHIGARCDVCRRKAERLAHRAQDEKRKKLKRGITAEAIWKKKVFALDGWKCRQCKCKVQKERIYANNAAELDHIIPLSKGGTHTYDNVQTLCRRCNQNKSDRIVPTQLRMALI